MHKNLVQLKKKIKLNDVETKSQFSFSTAKLSFKKISTIHSKSVYFDYFALKILIINYQRHPTRGGNGGVGGQYPLTQNDNKKRRGIHWGWEWRSKSPLTLSLNQKKRCKGNNSTGGCE